MSQHDFTIENQSAASARADINNALKALASTSSGPSAPSPTFEGMLWYETDTNTLKLREGSSWVEIGTFTSGTFSVAGLEFASKSEAEAGTNNTKLMTPLRVKQSAEFDLKAVGVNQTWQNVRSSRVLGTSYQNTTGSPIQVSITGSKANTLQVSENGSTWVTLGGLGAAGAFSNAFQFIVPTSHYYRITGGVGDDCIWTELR